MGMQKAKGRRRSVAGLTLILVVMVLGSVACSSDDGVAGTYVHEVEGTIELRSDGTWSIMQESGSAAEGEYEVEGTTITFFIDGQRLGTGTIEGDQLTDPDGKVFTKT